MNLRQLPNVSAALATLLVLPVGVHAQLAPTFNATYSEGIQPSDAGTAISNYTPGTISGGHNGANTLATALGGSDPSVFSEASGSANPTNRPVIYGTANAGVDYDFEIVGPGPMTSVPIDITGSLTTYAETAGQSVPIAGSEALAEIFFGPDLFAYWAAENPAILNAPSSVSMNSTMDFNSGLVYQVDLTATSSVGNLTDPAYSGISGTAQASVDPTFLIDPGFLLANPGFSLDLSANLGSQPPVNPVPESRDWGLAGAVLAVLVAGGARLRRGFTDWTNSGKELR